MSPRRTIKEHGLDPIDLFVAKRIRERRSHQRLSQSALAQALGVSFQAVQKYEYGNIRLVSIKLYRVAQVLDVTPSYFFEGYENAGPETRRRAKKAKR
jgi:transcriptional regulator with XRE-family HTH domain